MRVGSLAAACAFAVSPLAAQDTARAAQDSALRVFLDCPNSNCDFDYYRTEITFVNWVRDRQLAQVHVLVTAQQTGGGQEYTLTFIGLERFAGAEDTLHYLSHAADTQDDVRKGLGQVLRLGLVRFAARTPVAPHLEITYSAPAQTAAAVKDRWNFWVMNVGLSSFLRGEETQSFANLNTSLSANRITEKWKIRLSVNAYYSESNF